MGKRNMSIVFSSGIDRLKTCNSSFDSAVLRVCYTGRNRNNSFISKNTFERCIGSIYNCPVVCRYDRETDTIGAHDVEIVKDDDGMRLVNLTDPVGVVPESARYWWEEIEDDSGLHEYLCVDVLLWKRQEAYKKIKEDGITEQSMEITITDGEMVDGMYVIKQFEFTAFCLLGTAEPCFESAALETFAHNSFKEKFAEMMREVKETYTVKQPDNEVAIQTKNHSEGGEGVLEQKTALMNEYGFTADMLDFELDDFTVEELREKFEAMRAEAGENGDGDEQEHEDAPDESSEAPDESEDAPDANFALAEQFRNDLIEALGAETITDEFFGEMSRYVYVDYDSDAQEVYCYDMEDWKLYGIPYTMNGDVITVVFEDKKRKKIAFVDFDEGEQAAAFASIFRKMAEKYSANDSQWAEKFQNAENTIASMQGELGELRQFKADTESAAARKERDEVFAKFTDLEGIEAFEALRGNCDGYTMEDLEEKCYAIRGRNGTQVKFSNEQKAPKLPIEKKDNLDKKEPYGGLFTEYGFTANKQNN